jgi:FMN-dependent NADH-azoreductase
MNNLLFITSSLSGADSKSRRIAAELVASWRQAHPAGSVIERDLTPETMPHLTMQTLGALMTQADQRDEAQVARVAAADALIEEVEAADTIVITVPMYNFGIPSTLKAWIDHIARAGRTFRYSETGPKGLLLGKKVYVVTARGGVYSEGPAHGFDFQEPYLRAVLGFLGITDVEFVHVEGLAISPESAAQAIDRAREKVAALFPVAVAA